MVPRTSSREPPPPPSPHSQYLSATAQARVKSPSPSFDADDERSLSDPSSMEDGLRGGPAPARFAGDDVRLTSEKELRGWYSYGWAVEVFVVCGVGSFIPITLEQLARERGVLLSDKTSPCHASFDTSSPANASSFASANVLPRTIAGGSQRQCIIYFLGAEINTASFAMYTFSLSVLVQSLVIISMSGAADHGELTFLSTKLAVQPLTRVGNYRKRLMLIFAFTGATATMLFISVVPKIYLFGGLLAIVANVCFGASFVLLNSFLPLLVRHHPTIRRGTLGAASTRPSTDSADESSEDVLILEEGDDAVESLADSSAALLPRSSSGQTTPAAASPAAASPELQLSTKISSYGIGIGYIAAVLVQSLSVFIVILTGSTTFSLRLVLFVIGAWWFLFTFPAALWLRPRPGPPLQIAGYAGKEPSGVGYVKYAWQSLGKTIVRARRLKDVVLFLAAWFLLSDGIATVSGTAVLFAKTQLDMRPAALASINVVVTLCGILGAFSWSSFSRWMGLRPIQTILTCICLFELIPLYGLLGYIGPIRRLGVFGLQQPWEMYPLGAVYGLVLGGLSSYCRSLFGELIPPGSEAAFYALYAITDKGSSIFGPAIVGAITDRAGEIRPAFFFLAALVGLPAPLMWMIDVDRGRREGAAMAKDLSGLKSRSDLPSTRQDAQYDGVAVDEEDE
ncbi:MAG: Autophagy protein 22 [Piccolia ochrophora]|nr:MAG: Autophagy protein 22 [Piccolia ochrophora]